MALAHLRTAQILFCFSRIDIFVGSGLSFAAFHLKWVRKFPSCLLAYKNFLCFSATSYYLQLLRNSYNLLSSFLLGLGAAVIVIDSLLKLLLVRSAHPLLKKQVNTICVPGFQL